MKPLTPALWFVFVLEALFVLMLALQKNMGDDAAGRGMATGFAMLLGPVLLVAGALLWWGSRSGPALAYWVGACIVSAPLAWGVLDFAGGQLQKLGRALSRAEQGHFDDARLTRLARAIDAQDPQALRQQLAQGTPDWKARDRYGRTLLGHAIVQAIAYEAGPQRVECVRLLLAAGAPPAADAIAAQKTMASVSEHDVVLHLYGVHNPPALAVLDLLLAAGASPDTVDEDGRPLYFSSYTTLEALQVLARHQANFSRLDTRADRQGYTALMNAVSMRQWPEARFFLEQGQPPAHTAADGQSLHSLLAEVAPPGSTYAGQEATDHAAFLAALAGR